MIVRRLEAMITKRYRGDIQYRWIPLNQVPDDFLNGVWQIEDSRFFSHDGFDWIEMEEAIQRAKRKHQPVRGVSTISNQCARSLFLWQGRSWIRKGVEAYFTFLMEHLLTKQRIMELYVNIMGARVTESTGSKRPSIIIRSPQNSSHGRSARCWQQCFHTLEDGSNT